MGYCGKGGGEDGDSSKVPGNDVQVSCPGSAPVWEINLGGHRSDDDGPGMF